MKRLALLAAVVLLSACDPTEEERAKVRGTLPAGCEVHYLGQYGSISNLTVVTCDGRKTISTNYNESHGSGKSHTTHHQVTVTIKTS